MPESVQNTIDERLKATKEFEQKKETEIKQHRTANVIDPVRFVRHTVPAIFNQFTYIMFGKMIAGQIFAYV